MYEMIALFLNLLIRLDIFLLTLSLIKSKCLFLTLQSNLFQERLNLVVIILTEISLVTLNLDIKLLDSDLFGWLNFPLELFTLSFGQVLWWLYLNLWYFLYMFPLLYLVIHLLQFLLKPFLLIITSLLTVCLFSSDLFLRKVLFTITKLEILQLP